MSWGPGALGGFQNSLMMGMQIGENVNRSIMQGRQMREERDYKNALAQFDPSNPDTLKPIMAVRPEVGLQLQGQVEARQRAAMDERGKQLGVFRQLLTAAGDDPQRAFAAAQGMGLKLDGIPQPGTPEFEPWRQEQLFIVDALSDPEKMDQVDRDLERLGFPKGAPGREEAARELILFSRGKQGVDEYGRPVYDLPNIAMPGQSAAPQGAPPAPAPQQAQQAPQILPRTARPANLTDDQLFAAARRKVEEGADVNTVFQQLREWGVEVN